MGLLAVEIKMEVCCFGVLALFVGFLLVQENERPLVGNVNKISSLMGGGLLVPPITLLSVCEESRRAEQQV